MKRFIVIALMCGFATTMGLKADYIDSYNFNEQPIGYQDISSLKYMADKILGVDGIKYQCQYDIPDDSVFWKWAATEFKDLDTTVYPGSYALELAKDYFFSGKNRLEQKSQQITYGFFIDEVEKVWPEIVISHYNNGVFVEKYLNTSALFPVIIEAIKDLKLQLQVLNSQVKDHGIINGITGDDCLVPYLYQNNPNPFNKNTVIKFFIPDNSLSACIRIYDMVGSELMKIDITDRGYASMSFEGNKLKAGMYLYSLIVDGKEIDTKRMILTGE